MNAIAQASAAPARGPKLDNRRVLAGIADLLIVSLGAAVILYAADALGGDRSDARGALSAVILGWALYYYFALESGDGQTVGKKLTKLRVVRADGSPVGMREVAVRTILRVVDGAGAYIVGLIVMLATGERRQRVGDLAAGTIVVDASAPPLAPAAAGPAAGIDEDSADGGDDETGGEEATAAESATITLPRRPAPTATTEPAAPEARASEELPKITSPSIEYLARDVEAVRGESEDEPAAEDEPVEEEVSVKSVETVSAIDLIMGTEPSRDGGETASR